MPHAITREQRDALRHEAVTALGDIAGVYLALEEGDYEPARRRRRRREFEPLMRLLDDVGWGREDPGESFELTLPDAQLAEVGHHLGLAAADRLQTYLERRLDERVDANDAQRCVTVALVCGELLQQTGLPAHDAAEERQGPRA